MSNGRRGFFGRSDERRPRLVAGGVEHPFLASAALAGTDKAKLFEEDLHHVVLRRANVLSPNRRKPAFALAVGDFLKAPVVGAIDLSGYAGKSGGKIAIVATDDVGVAGVSVVIRNTVDSTVIEQGVALEEAGKWRYTATADAPAGASIVVEVTASDRPGNKAVKTEAKP